MLDPLPAKQLTDNIISIVPAITRITNASLDVGVMPKSLKHAIVRPLLKKPSLDKDTMSSYRPVSNLTQLSNVIEKMVALRIMTRVSDQQMVECFQSAAYRKKHSTETALLSVTGVVKTEMDTKQGTILLLVNFSSAFDTINWTGWYLIWKRGHSEYSNRWPVVEYNYSNDRCPASPVLGPLLFSLYV